MSKVASRTDAIAAHGDSEKISLQANEPEVGPRGRGCWRRDFDTREGNQHLGRDAKPILFPQDFRCRQRATMQQVSLPGQELGRWSCIRPVGDTTNVSQMSLALCPENQSDALMLSGPRPEIPESHLRLST